MIEIRDVKVEDAVQTMEFKGWEWFPRVGWVCPSCQKARP